MVVERVFSRKCTFIFQKIVGNDFLYVYRYGETGSGKTHTMEGVTDDPGVVLRSLKSIFHETKASTEFNTEISMCTVEVYNEEIKYTYNDISLLLLIYMSTGIC